jgi:GNAT superfamily N-acetyltransferase
VNAILQVQGDQLTEAVYARLNEASLHEFSVPLPPRPQLADRRYFLLMEAEQQRILASGFLRPVYPVIYRQTTFSFLNIGGVIANEKGQGFGRQLMSALREYLTATSQTGLGFCWPKNQGFYEKCGFTVETHATQRFVALLNGQRSTAEGQYILYLDGKDGMLRTILADPQEIVYVPDASIW